MAGIDEDRTGMTGLGSHILVDRQTRVNSELIKSSTDLLSQE